MKDQQHNQIHEARRRVAELLPSVRTGNESDEADLFRTVEAYAVQARARIEQNDETAHVVSNKRLGSITHEDIPGRAIDKHSRGNRGTRGGGRWSDYPKLPGGRDVVTHIDGIDDYLAAGPVLSFNIVVPPHSRQSGPQETTINTSVPRRISVAAYTALNSATTTLGFGASSGGWQDERA